MKTKTGASGKPVKDSVLIEQETAIIDLVMPMNINPVPDSITRIWFYFTEVNGSEPKAPDTVEVIRREGYSVVEWGGMVEYNTF